MKTVVIIGTGIVARAIAARFKKYKADEKYIIHIMTSSSDKIGIDIFNISVSAINKEVCQSADIIVLAIPATAMPNIIERISDDNNRLPAAAIDCSNYVGNGIYLQSEFPNIQIIKTFTSIRAYDPVDPEFSVVRPTDEMILCGDNPNAVVVSKEFLQDLGYSPTSLPDITFSLELENANFKNFNQWHGAILANIFIFILFLAYAITERNLAHERQWYAQSLKNMNAAASCAALFLFGIVYAAGGIARIIQSFRKDPLTLETHKFLVMTLYRRKNLGLVAMFNLLIHVQISMLLFGSSYFQYFSKNGELTNTANASLICGVMGFSGFMITSLTSLPSIANTLGMTEWITVQLYIGCSSLVLATAHVLIMGYENMLSKTKWGYQIPSLFLLAAIVPAFALLTRVLSFICNLCHRLLRSCSETDSSSRIVHAPILRGINGAPNTDDDDDPRDALIVGIPGQGRARFAPGVGASAE